METCKGRLLDGPKDGMQCVVKGPKQKLVFPVDLENMELQTSEPLACLNHVYSLMSLCEGFAIYEYAGYRESQLADQYLTVEKDLLESVPAILDKLNKLAFWLNVLDIHVEEFEDLVDFVVELVQNFEV